MERRSPKPQAAGLIPAGNAICVPCEGATQIAGHLAAKVPDAAALHPFTLSEKLNVYWECCLYFVSNLIVQIYDR